MTKMLITGGSRSGKSACAEKLAAFLSPDGSVLYTATARIWDEETALRVENHKKRRPAAWDTLEAGESSGTLSEVLIQKAVQYDVILIDCLIMHLTNRLFAMIKDQDPDSLSKNQYMVLTEMAAREASNLADFIMKAPCHVLLVTGEIGSGVVPEHVLGRLFRDMLGTANQILARTLPEVTLMVCGLPVVVKGGDQAKTLLKEADIG